MLRMRYITVFLSYMAFGLMLPFLLTHTKLRHGIARRLGYYPANWSLKGHGPRVWVHGASAGDILALLPTVRELKKAQPQAQIIASTMTNSGYAIAQRYTDLFAEITYLPYDLPGAVKRTFKRLKPHMLVLEYTELWPNLIAHANAQKIPVVLHNGRLNDTRLVSYRWLFFVTGNLLQALHLLLMRDAREAKRALALGANPQRLHITGNTKFDSLNEQPPPQNIAQLKAALNFDPESLIWVAGSTHEGEEELLLQVFARLRQRYGNLVMVIAPRYIERAERIVLLATKHGFKARLRSEMNPKISANVVVVNTLGELPACYSLATLVFVGGSFVARGGQNILEPAACGKPVLFGPCMHNFADSVQVLLGRGGIQVASPEQLHRIMLDLLKRKSHRRELGNIARNQVLAIRGAAKRNAKLMTDILVPP